jgi:hypothetical protein
MSRRMIAVVTSALVLAAACGTDAPGPRADGDHPTPPVATPADPLAPPGVGDTTSQACIDVDDLTVSLGPDDYKGPSVHVVPDCSSIDPGPFTTPPGPGRHIDRV